MKKEFDHYRDIQQPHPLMLQYGIQAVPFQHKDLDTWRSNFKGITFLHESNFLLSGAIDDVWANGNGELIICDFKATASKEKVIELNTTYRQSYRKQLEFYQYIFRNNGFKVSEKCYLIYANGKSDRDSFNGKLEFDMQILELIGDTSWVDGALSGARECLMGNLPEPNPDCELCSYVQLAGNAGS